MTLRRLALVAVAAMPAAARAQALDLSHGGPVTVTALGGIDWDQKAQTVTAYTDARAVRGVVTVDADRLIAFYRKKATATGTAAPGATSAGASTGTTAAATTTTLAAPGAMSAAAKAPGSSGATVAVTTKAAATAAAATPPSPDTMPGAAPAATASGPGSTTDPEGANEIYRLEAIGHVHIYTATDQAWGDHGIYDIDQAVLVLTGHALKLVTPSDTITARDSLEYHPPTHVSVARGNAVLVTNDGRRIAADILVGYSVPDNAPAGGATAATRAAAPAAPAKPGADPLTSSGKLKKAEAYGNVVVRTQTETVIGDRGVYVTDTGIARIMGNVHITRGQNQLNGRAAIVNMHTGLATMTEDPGSRVQGLIVPNDNTANAPAGSAGAKPRGRPATAGGRS